MERINNKLYYDIGIDVTELKRFQNLSENFIKRFLTTKEYTEYLKLDDSIKTKFLASRWVLKEAVFKAISKYKPIPFVQIEFEKDEKGFVKCTNIPNVKISLSYCSEKVYGIAMVII